MTKPRRYGPLVAWLIAFVIVRTALQDHGYGWTWILVGLAVLFGLSMFLNHWRHGSGSPAPPTPLHHAGAEPRTGAPSEPTAVGFRRGMLVAMGALGVALSALSAVGVLIVVRDFPQRHWLGVVVGAFMVLSFGLFSWWVVFAVRGLLGRSALILDAHGLTDQSSPIPLGQVAWDDIRAIHWQWPGSPLATRPFVAVDRRNGYRLRSDPLDLRRILGSRGLDPAKLAISDEELAHEFRRYSSGRFGIRRR